MKHLNTKILITLGVMLVTGCSMDGPINSVVAPPPEPEKPYERAQAASVAQIHLVLPRLRASTGVNYENNATLLTVVNDLSPTLSGSGDLTDFSSQLSLGAMEIVAAFCGVAATGEAAPGRQKLLFTGIDLNQAPSVISSEGKRAFIDNLSIRFLARPASSEDISLGVSTLDQIIASYPATETVAGRGQVQKPSKANTAGTRMAVQALCTVWGASVDALLY